jgi:two-component system, chemotaxis family, chemotaxis protein CheY
MTDGRAPALILVVDDDSDILEALSEILEGEGYRVERARNGQEALEKLDGERPALILLDLMMPVMDGWEFAARLRQRDGDRDIPVVVLSADRQVGPKAKELQAAGYLAKPFELADLLSVVNRFAVRRAAPA